MKRLLLSAVPVLAILLIAAQAAPAGQDPTVTYTISLQEDGSAIWNMEYRTPLLSENDTAAFQDYASQIQTVSLPEYTELMRRSAAQASTATGRPVGVSNFTADSAIQAGPTGSYGVVHLRCLWSGFASRGDSLTVGDVFVGGLYLGKDHALVIRPPQGYSALQAAPAPDRTGDGLTWYGLRSFGAGEPRVVFGKETFPWFPALLGIIIVAIALGIYTVRRRIRPTLPAPAAAQAAPADQTADLELGDRILALLAARGGSLHQSELVETLGLPKSTVSEAINRLHDAGKIEKVRKGRENLIRIPPPGKDG